MLATKSVSQYVQVWKPCGLRAAPFRTARSVLFVRASSKAAAPAESSAAAPAPKLDDPIPLGAASDYVVDSDFSISKVSFGSILTPLGSALLFFGFGAYFQLWGGGDFSSVALVYGFPMALLGFALSYAQLEPVGCRSNQKAVPLRDSQMTDIQKQVRDDTTRFRYGDEQHLEEGLYRIWRVGKSGGINRKVCPVLKGLREEVVDGAYTLIMEFDSKLDDAAWAARADKYASFFGPGVNVRISRTSDKSVDVALISDGSGAGRGGGERPDALVPLLPGLKTRQAK